MESFLSLYILSSTHICVSDSSKYSYCHYRYTLLEQFLLSKLHSMSFLLWISQLLKDRQSLGCYCSVILKYLLRVLMVVRGRTQCRIQDPSSEANVFLSIWRSRLYTDCDFQGRAHVLLPENPHHLAQCLAHHLAQCPQCLYTQGRGSLDCRSNTKWRCYMALLLLLETCLDLYFSRIKWKR